MVDPDKPRDLVVLNLDWSTREWELREYFQDFGELTRVQMGRPRWANEVRGFAHIRFAHQRAEERVLAMTHPFRERWVPVRVHRRQKRVRVKSRREIVADIAMDLRKHKANLAEAANYREYRRIKYLLKTRNAGKNFPEEDFDQLHGPEALIMRRLKKRIEQEAVLRNRIEREAIARYWDPRNHPPSPFPV